MTADRDSHGPFGRESIESNPVPQERRLERPRRASSWSSCCSLFPYYVGAGTTNIMVQGLIVLTLASMWNLLAGYAGLVSVGQQAFVGLGAYFVLILAMHGVTPLLGLSVAAIGAGVCALPLWWLVSRLRTGYFAIATWVLASIVILFIEQIPSLGGGTGSRCPG